jgi:hypothetical protein
MKNITRFNADFAYEVEKRFPGVTVTPSTFMFKHGYQHGWQMAFANGFVASIQFGPFNYCSNRNLAPIDWGAPPTTLWTETAFNAEIAGWWRDVDGVDGEMVKFDGWNDTVAGWKEPHEVLEWLDEYAS